MREHVKNKLRKLKINLFKIRKSREKNAIEFVTRLKNQSVNYKIDLLEVLNFRQLIQLYSIDLIVQREEIIKLAVKGLTEGYKSTNLNIAAGLTYTDSLFDIKSYLNKAIEELNILIYSPAKVEDMYKVFVVNYVKEHQEYLIYELYELVFTSGITWRLEDPFQNSYNDYILFDYLMAVPKFYSEKSAIEIYNNLLESLTEVANNTQLIYKEFIEL